MQHNVLPNAALMSATRRADKKRQFFILMVFVLLPLTPVLYGLAFNERRKQ